MKESPNKYYIITSYKICQIPKNICNNLIEIIPIKLTIENIKYTILSLIWELPIEKTIVIKNSKQRIIWTTLNKIALNIIKLPFFLNNWLNYNTLLN